MNRSGGDKNTKSTGCAGETRNVASCLDQPKQRIEKPRKNTITTIRRFLSSAKCSIYVIAG
jgi:hypothetical protein